MDSVLRHNSKSKVSSQVMRNTDIRELSKGRLHSLQSDNYPTDFYTLFSSCPHSLPSHRLDNILGKDFLFLALSICSTRETCGKISHRKESRDKQIL